LNSSRLQLWLSTQRLTKRASYLQSGFVQKSNSVLSTWLITLFFALNEYM
jgi:hypothetical protein